MKINSGTVAMASTRSYNYSATTNETTVRKSYDAYGNPVGTSASAAVITTSQFELEGGASVHSTADGQTSRADKNSVTVKNGINNEQQQETKPAVTMQTAAQHMGNIGDALAAIDVSDDPMLVMLRRMLSLIEHVTGQKTSMPLAESMDRNRPDASIDFSAIFGKASVKGVGMAAVSAAAPRANGYWIKHTVSSGFEQGSENTAFSSNGSVTTEDGRTIDFSVTAEMSRSFANAFSITGEEEVYAFTDPLVINLDGGGAQLSDAKFYFDLDSDGEREELFSLKSGSGFLALDKNGDGEINNGSELFGAKTGDGFSELSAYDSDGNGWIDENDTVYKSLSVWTKDENGDDRLIALSKAGVGAIFLGSQKTGFTLTDSEGNEGAIVRSTGVFLGEDGSAKTIQHIDFLV